jgi:hypothetical protein
MASAVRQITSVGGDIRKIARLLQKKAPPGHMLAYINQEEADLLKERGGSGAPHADTGIPSFEDEDLVPLEPVTETPYVPIPTIDVSEQGYEPRPAASEYGGYDVTTTTPTEVAQPFSAEQYAQYGAGRQAAEAYRPEFTVPEQYQQYGAGRQYADQAAALDRIQPTQVKPDLDLLGRAAKATGLKEETLQKLGISGLQGLFGAYTANKAAEAGQAGKAEMMALAAPYRQQGQEMIGKAQRGELTPVGQQQLQAVQAQAAQGAERRGGVGAQQSMAQVEAFRQQLLQGQYDYGLRLSGIADNIVTGAIKTGLQADQYVSNLTNSYFGNMARIMAGVEDKKPTTGA